MYYPLSLSDGRKNVLVSFLVPSLSSSSRCGLFLHLSSSLSLFDLQELSPCLSRESLMCLVNLSGLLSLFRLSSLSRRPSSPRRLSRTLDFESSSLSCTSLKRFKHIYLRSRLRHHILASL